MFPPMELENERMVLRPMNCPHHILIYESKPRSYRDLPVRLAELGTMYRYELSGALSGLSRGALHDAERCAHLLHAGSDQGRILEGDEAGGASVSRSRDHASTAIACRCATPRTRRSSLTTTPCGNSASSVLRDAMDSLGLKYKEAHGEAAFYGPKVDIQLADVMGHEETYSTIQMDFHLPSQFDLEYTGADGNKHRPVMIHRGVISTMERMTSISHRALRGRVSVLAGAGAGGAGAHQRAAHGVREEGAGGIAVPQGSAWNWTRATRR